MPLYPPNPHKQLRNRLHNKTERGGVNTSPCSGGMTDRDNQGKKQRMTYLLHLQSHPQRCRVKYACTLKHRLNRNAHIWIKTHICIYYLISIIENNLACSHYIQKLIHICAYFLSLPIPRHRRCDKLVSSCCHVFVQVAHFRFAFTGLVNS